METQKIPNSQNNCKKEKWSWKNKAPWLTLYYMAAVAKTVGY